MGHVEKPIIQIAGVKSQYEADIIMAEGVKYIGFPLRLDVHEPDITEQEAASIIRSFPADVHAVLITYENNLCEIIKMLEFLRVDTIQFHGDIETKTLKVLKRYKENITIFKSLIVRGDNTAELKKQIEEFEPFVDAFILDTFDEETGASGATGKTHDSKISRELVLKANRPVILAGGLTPVNVTKIIRDVRPAGVDCHTGIEDENGNKDRKKLRMFVQRARHSLGMAEDDE